MYKIGGLVDMIEDGVIGFLFGEFLFSRFMDVIRRGFDIFCLCFCFMIMCWVVMNRFYGWDCFVL